MLQLTDTSTLPMGEAVTSVAFGYFGFWLFMLRTSGRGRSNSPKPTKPVLGRDSYQQLCIDATIWLFVWFVLALGMCAFTEASFTTQGSLRSLGFLSGATLAFANVLFLYRDKGG